MYYLTKQNFLESKRMLLLYSCYREFKLNQDFEHSQVCFNQLKDLIVDRLSIFEKNNKSKQLDRDFLKEILEIL